MQLCPDKVSPRITRYYRILSQFLKVGKKIKSVKYEMNKILCFISMYGMVKDIGTFFQFSAYNNADGVMLLNIVDVVFLSVILNVSI